MVGAERLSKGDAPPAATDEAAVGYGIYSALVLPADAPALETYAAFCAGARHAPPQSPLWTRAWLEGAGPDGTIALLSREGVPIMALALEMVRKGPLRIARFPGGTHANGNFPAIREAPQGGEVDWPAALRALVSGIRSARPELDLLALQRQRTDFAGHGNPLLALPHTTSPNLSLAVDLSQGFERLLTDSGGRRRRKRHRSQLRRLAAAGGHRRFAAATASEVDALLDLFFALKCARLERMGIRDIFGPSHVRASFRRLFRAALDHPKPPFVLHALEAGGKIRAVTGSSRTRESIICEFSTFAEDELAHASPGDFLFYENIAEAAAEGLALYDFSVGDELYKRLWCDVEIRHADVFAGLTVKGSAAAQAGFAIAGLKRVIKQNRLIDRLARRARRLSAKG
ncbi:GNAT family N-acetyltransferase [Chelativorans sp. AA-79]|uniref:GNAT family N-acetyltransferase n=1 Tax=Chelativorans sp. AA-79 TaxID=3028735 RepID=UPI0023F6DA1A|nr:GNAT family N-acetyltransferase [Chelativorans sp. AA-79]WEX11596.1 GNAT family N-acetyltransferase [Chelativorans sp. AA-79]